MSLRMLALTVLGIVLCSCSREEPATKAPTPKLATQPAAVTETAAVVPDKGRELFEYWCLPCHGAGPGHAGTMALAQRLGPEQSVLLERDNLTPEYVKYVVRNGLQMMPPLMPTEITDAGLEPLAQYVASVGKQKK